MHLEHILESNIYDSKKIVESIGRGIQLTKLKEKIEEAKIPSENVKLFFH